MVPSEVFYVCVACGFFRKDEWQVCFKCGSHWDALEHLLSHGLQPKEILEISTCIPNQNGITIKLAKDAVEAFRTKHDKPN